jgi:hypothetical protein
MLQQIKVKEKKRKKRKRRGRRSRQQEHGTLSFHHQLFSKFIELRLSLLGLGTLGVLHAYKKFEIRERFDPI